MQPIPDLLARTDELKAELDAMRPLPRDVEDRVLQKFRLWWTFHSNAIEGNSLTQGETEMFLMEGLTAKGKPFKDHLDIKGHHNAINFLLDLVREKRPLTEADIRKLHEVLLVEPYMTPALTPDGQETRKLVAIGEYKQQPNHVRTPTGEMHYYASPLDTPPRMQAMVARVRQDLEEGKNVIEVVAWMHHEFTAIHPFDDGNGRMARLLTNLLLMQAGYPPVVIRKEERNAYIAALREADQGDLRGLTQFLAEHIESSLSLYLRAARGEEIHEPNDLEKEIALLTQSFQHVEEVPTLTLEVQREFIVKSLDPLYKEIRRLLLPLAEMFNRANVEILASGSKIINSGFYSLRNLVSLSSELGDQPADKADSLYICFDLRGFKKHPEIIFNAEFQLPFKFGGQSVFLELPTIAQSFRWPTGGHLSSSDISAISQAVVKHFIQEIKRKTGSEI